jgi:hypothetical protein
MEKNITATNRMSGTQLKATYGTLDFIKNPHTGKLFFTAGSITGYVSPKVAAKVDTITLDEIQYAEVSIDGNPAVPTLMLKSTANVVRSL